MDTKPILRSNEQVAEYLEKDGFEPWKALAARVRAGDLSFEFGNAEWPSDWYTPNAWENKSWPLVFAMAMRLPEIKKFKLYYRRDHDFHHIDFEYQGEAYSVRWYKVYGANRVRDGKSVTFYIHYDDVVNFFARDKHREDKNWW